MAKECKHKKVYSDQMIATMPPKMRWICKKCLEEGIDVMRTSSEIKYDELKKQKCRKDNNSETEKSK